MQEQREQKKVGGGAGGNQKNKQKLHLCSSMTSAFASHYQVSVTPFSLASSELYLS